MKRLLLLLALLAGCTSLAAPGSTVGPDLSSGLSVSVWHDDARHVTCWLYYSRGISCLPDAQVAK